MVEFTKKTRFNQLKENQPFTFRKNGNITNRLTDIMFRADGYMNCENLNAFNSGGAWFDIHNKRSIVWTYED